jgi:hypothetical protein
VLSNLHAFVYIIFPIEICRSVAVESTLVSCRDSIPRAQPVPCMRVTISIPMPVRREARRPHTHVQHSPGQSTFVQLTRASTRMVGFERAGRPQYCTHEAKQQSHQARKKELAVVKPCRYTAGMCGHTSCGIDPTREESEIRSTIKELICSLCQYESMVPCK